MMEEMACFTTVVIAILLTLIIVKAREEKFTSMDDDNTYSPGYLAGYSSPYYFFS